MLRSGLHAEAEAEKCPQRGVVLLSQKYGELTASNRIYIDKLLAEWIVSADEGKRFDALAIVFDHKIYAMLPALGKLASLLSQLDTVGAPFELAKVSRVIDKRGQSAFLVRRQWTGTRVRYASSGQDKTANWKLGTPTDDRVYGMPGGAYEMKFPYAVPPEFVKILQ
jgi:hypothetical protein